MTMVILIFAGGYLLFVFLKEAHKEDATALTTCILCGVVGLLACAGVYKLFDWLEGLVSDYLPLVIIMILLKMFGSLAALFFGVYFTMLFAATAATSVRARTNKGVEDRAEEVFKDKPKPQTLTEKANEVFSDDEKGG